jgi:hypothetical protein
MNLNGFYQTTNKSITNTSSSFSNTQSTPPKVNNTTNEFGNVVTFNQGIRLLAGTSISIVDGDEVTEPLASTDLYDTDDIAYLDVENEFTYIPTYKDSDGKVHQFLIAPVDSTPGQSSLHATETTVINDVSTHTTKPLKIPDEHFEKNAGGISIHRLPCASTELHNSFKKQSPYRAITGNDKGALIGRLITDYF